jgi:hypothetical protein
MAVANWAEQAVPDGRRFAPPQNAKTFGGPGTAVQESAAELVRWMWCKTSNVGHT